ncbi:hypothetical protein AB0B45_34060 [Nonomuraea sp. NPDC049152]|uniref:hypothetical protein n=1 Tax=Nonomuraea sp. NPDC049152 TaxID=3154350 RepID=UPI0033E2041F
MSELPVETGDERVDAVVGGLAATGALPVRDHVAVFEEAFSALEEALASVDDQ